MKDFSSSCSSPSNAIIQPLVLSHPTPHVVAFWLVTEAQPFGRFEPSSRQWLGDQTCWINKRSARTVIEDPCGANEIFAEKGGRHLMKPVTWFCPSRVHELVTSPCPASSKRRFSASETICRSVATVTELCGDSHRTMSQGFRDPSSPKKDSGDGVRSDADSILTLERRASRRLHPCSS